MIRKHGGIRDRGKFDGLVVRFAHQAKRAGPFAANNLAGKEIRARGHGPGGFFGGDNRHKYNLTIGLEMQNVLNHTNLMSYGGNLSSPFFGIANQARNGRRLVANLRFSF